MLLEFRVENHRSLFDEQALTFECIESDNSADPHLRKISGCDALISPIAAIYGANASGKSNVLKAFNFMRKSVVESQRLWNPDGGIPRETFAWAGGSEKSSIFEVTFIQEEKKYEYGFSANDQFFEEEWLFVWSDNQKQIWFERDKDEYSFGDDLKGSNTFIQELTRPNSLFLSAAAQNNHKQLSLIFSWFSKIIFAEEGHQVQFTFAPSLHNNALGIRLIKLLQSADIGIVDVGQVKEDHSSNISPRIIFQHQHDDELAWLDLKDESDGTKTLFSIAPSLFSTLDNGSVLVIDELESSLHPLLALTIIKLFSNPETNPNNAQLLFTTHDTNLLGTVLGDTPLRRDQVWFTEKDSSGKSYLYPLTDFKPRPPENVEQGYLQGRYGAIPFLGDFLKRGWNEQTK